MEKKLKLVGPFRQLLPMSNMPLNGAIHDKQLPIIEEGGILIAGNKILDVAVFDQLEQKWGEQATRIHIAGDQVALPGFIAIRISLLPAIGQMISLFEMQVQVTLRLQLPEVGSGAQFRIQGIVNRKNWST